ncbi:MAG TPA: DUF6502 family protein [Pelomicrobium sp.]|nr:DUF6502 family protein [Pelomicrobium sp.]
MPKNVSNRPMHSRRTSAIAPPPAVVEAIRRVLEPLGRLCMAHGITYPFLAEMMKEVLVEVADRDFRVGGERPTDSRVSLATGVHRKDVRRLRSEAPHATTPAPAAVTLGSQLVALWTTTPEFLDSDGRPQPLARLASAGGSKSFERLVERVSKDIRPRSVLDEWVRLGVAHLDDADRVCLNVDAFVPAHGLAEKAYYLGLNVGDHMAAAGHNMGTDGAFLERSVAYDALSPESVNELAKLAEGTAMAALRAVNARAMELEELDPPSPETRCRINFGVYFYREPMPPAEPGDER